MSVQDLQVRAEYNASYGRAKQDVGSEAWYRDYFYMNPRLITRSLDFPSRSFGNIKVFKEYQVSSGRIDLLIVNHQAAIICEFKKEIIDESAVGQVGRYRGCFPSDFETYMCLLAPSFTKEAIYAAKGFGITLIRLVPIVEVYATELQDDHVSSDCDKLFNHVDDLRNRLFAMTDEEVHSHEKKIEQCKLDNLPFRDNVEYK